MDKYVCKVATVDEMNNKWDYEINHATKNKENWIIWKKKNIERFQNGFIIPYYGILNENAHRADSDTLATAKLFMKIRLSM